VRDYRTVLIADARRWGCWNSSKHMADGIWPMGSERKDSVAIGRPSEEGLAQPVPFSSPR